MPLFLIRVLEHITARANEAIDDTSFIHISRAPNSWLFYAIFYSLFFFLFSSHPPPLFFALFSYG